MKTKWMKIGGAFITFFIAASLRAQAPQLLNYQGKLTNKDGTAVAGALTITFSIYATPSGGTALWTETRNFTVTNGVFNVLMGSVNPLVNRLTNKGLFAEAGERYLGIKVGADPEMAPRFQLTSVAYAIKSSQADKATTADTARVAQMAYSLNTATGTQTNAVFVGNNGNIGIGTTVPASLLDVRGTIRAGTFSNPLSGSGPSVEIGVDAELKGVIQANNRTATGILLPLFFSGSDFRFSETGAEIMRIDGGSVGIGTTTPMSKLHVVGNETNAGENRAGIRLQDTGANQTWTLNSFGTGAGEGGGKFGINQVGRGNRLIIDTSGYVGIGTTIPTFRLDIQNAALGQVLGNAVDWFRLAGLSGNYDQLQIFHRRHTNGTSWQSAEIKIQKRVDVTDQQYISFKGNAGTSNLEFGYGNTTQMTILENGNVGIANTSPQHILDVNAKDGEAQDIARLGHIGGKTNGFRIFKDAQNQYSYTFETGNVGIKRPPDPLFALAVNGRACGTSNYEVCSDLRYKKNIAAIPNAIDKITRLRGVSFDWRQEEFPELNFNKGKNLGFIAQEIKEVLPEVVSQDSKGYYSVAYSNVVPVLVEAIKEQQQTIAQLQTQLQQTGAELAGFKEKMSHIEAALQRLAGCEENSNDRNSGGEKIAGKEK